MMLISHVVMWGSGFSVKVPGPSPWPMPKRRPTRGARAPPRLVQRSKGPRSILIPSLWFTCDGSKRFVSTTARLRQLRSLIEA